MMKESLRQLPRQGDKSEAKKHTGTTSEILRGEQRQPFGSGQIGTVAQERVAVIRNGEAREKDLVVKRFKEDVRWRAHSIEEHLRAYHLLKSAGIKHIPTTYRQIGPRDILMTDYNRNDSAAVSPHNKNERADGLCIDSIVNFPEFLSSIDEDMRQAAEAEIWLIPESYFFVVPKSGGEASIDFAIADLGGIISMSLQLKNDFYRANVNAAEQALLEFISSCVNEDIQEEYRKQVTEWATSLVKEGIPAEGE